MAYTKNWIETDPVGSAITISQLDNSDRDIKVAVRERLEGDAADALSGVIITFATLAHPKLGAGRFYCGGSGSLGAAALQDGRGYFTTDAGNSHPKLYSMETAGFREIAYLNRDGSRPFLSQFTVDIDVTTNQGSVEGVIVDMATAAAVITVGSMVGVVVRDPAKGAGSTITILYGIKVENLTDGGSNYSLYTGAGRVRLQDNFGASGAFQLWDNGEVILGKSGQTAAGTQGHVYQQTVSANPTGVPSLGAGASLFDATNNTWCIYNGAAWKKVVLT